MCKFLSELKPSLRLTRIPHTIEISSAVGTTWNTTDESRNEMPLHAEQDP